MNERTRRFLVDSRSFVLLLMRLALPFVLSSVVKSLESSYPQHVAGRSVKGKLSQQLFDVTHMSSETTDMLCLHVLLDFTICGRQISLYRCPCSLAFVCVIFLDLVAINFYGVICVSFRLRSRCLFCSCL